MPSTSAAMLPDWLALPISEIGVDNLFLDPYVFWKHLFEGNARDAEQ